jgi:hypothetical protein
VGFAEEGGDHGGDQQNHEQWRKDDQAGGERDQAQGVLADVEDGRQKANTAGGLAAGALQLVIENGIFKGGQIQLRGVFNEPNADSVGEAIAEQAVSQGICARQQVAEDGEA